MYSFIKVEEKRNYSGTYAKIKKRKERRRTEEP